MFCRKCGYQIADNARFCPKCGEQVADAYAGYSEGYTNSSEDDYSSYTNDSSYNSDTYGYSNESYTSGSSANTQTSGVSGDDKINIKGFLTEENIERFAPLATVIPLAMVILLKVLILIEGLFNTVIYTVRPVYVIFTVIFFLVKLIFTVAAAAATGGLIYIAVNRKNTACISTWVAPFVSLLATISCIAIDFSISGYRASGWIVVAWITGIIALVAGIEFIARIVISKKPMDSEVDPKGAIDTYKQFYNDYKEKYPSSTQMEKAGIEDPENSKFDGTGLELFGLSLLAVLVSLITCGIAAPWMICKIYRWRISHTVINGKRLVFTGSGGSLFGHWILWELLTIVTCGIYGFFLHVALRKWELSHTFIDGEPVSVNGNTNVSFFDGGSFAYFGYSLIFGILFTLSCGIAYPWLMVMIQKWDTKHQVINNRRLVFSGTGLGLLGEFLIILILTIITCGIYSSWGIVRLNKYVIRNTDFAN